MGLVAAGERVDRGRGNRVSWTAQGMDCQGQRWRVENGRCRNWRGALRGVATKGCVDQQLRGDVLRGLLARWLSGCPEANTAGWPNRQCALVGPGKVWRGMWTRNPKSLVHGGRSNYLSGTVCVRWRGVLGVKGDVLGGERRGSRGERVVAVRNDASLAFIFVSVF